MTVKIDFLHDLLDDFRGAPTLDDITDLEIEIRRGFEWWQAEAGNLLGEAREALLSGLDPSEPLDKLASLFNEAAEREALLGKIGLTTHDFPRSPRVWLAESGADHPTSYCGPYPAVVIDVRLGGDNREAYEEEISSFMEEGNIEFTEDCSGDKTYAYFIKGINSHD